MSRENHRYDDIISLPHPVSAERPHMSAHDRAAQFSPFAALTGFDGAVGEAARRTEERIELEADEKERLDARLRRLQACIAERPEAAFTYFRPDDRKAGGAYVTISGRVKRLDPLFRTVLLTDGAVIPMDDILAIEGALFREPDES